MNSLNQQQQQQQRQQVRDEDEEDNIVAQLHQLLSLAIINFDESIDQLLNNCSGKMKRLIREKDQCGRTLLMLACEKANANVVKRLLAFDECNINESDHEGNTPLIYAAQAGHYQIVELLLFYSMNYITNENHINNERIMNYNRFSNINQTNHNGFTALIKAAVQGRTECILLLMGNGADVNIRDHCRQLKASEWAKLCNRNETYEVINNFQHTSKYRELVNKQWELIKKFQANQLSPSSSKNNSGDFHLKSRTSSSLRVPNKLRQFFRNPLSSSATDMTKTFTTKCPRHSSSLSKYRFVHRSIRRTRSERVKLPKIEITQSTND
ncbi:hypothetical protein SNEBB_009170 [Seison nebaliae]|nr:hypothetical protein SNEBB_009170 [Seison nebaliae]